MIFKREREEEEKQETQRERRRDRQTDRETDRQAETGVGEMKDGGWRSVEEVDTEKEKGR